MAQGADVNARTSDGLTPLMLAAKNGRTEIITALLLDQGADVKAKTDYDTTALMLAAQNGHTETVALLSDR